MNQPEMQDQNEPIEAYQDWMDDLRLGFSFLTRLPVPGSWGTDEAAGKFSLAQASRFFGIVGLVVGIIGAAVLLLGAWAGLPHLAASILALGAIALVTGGLHEDGLADTADGIGGASSRERRLEIMSDSRIGTYGVLALIFVIGLKAAALSSMTSASEAAITLFAAAAASRGFLPLFMHYLPAAKADGMSSAAGKPEFNHAGLSAAIVVVALFIAFGFWLSLGALIAAAIVSGVLAMWALRALGGQTGDVLGAIQQVIEVTLILAVSAAGLS
ncbi:MAG: adenosylcobinamide-GDP ribazoletransferase [Rhodospirillales bacterium]|nr:adenosylcobinamide-GDP ribazoletransferase [Rhodospirillales bacterium]